MSGATSTEWTYVHSFLTACAMVPFSVSFACDVMHVTTRKRIRLWAAVVAQAVIFVTALGVYLFLVDTPGEDAFFGVILAAAGLGGSGIAFTYYLAAARGQELVKTPKTDVQTVLVVIVALTLIHFFLQPPVSGEDFQKWMDELNSPEALPFE